MPTTSPENADTMEKCAVDASDRLPNHTTSAYRPPRSHASPYSVPMVASSAGFVPGAEPATRAPSRDVRARTVAPHSLGPTGRLFGGVTDAGGAAGAGAAGMSGGRWPNAIATGVATSAASSPAM